MKIAAICLALALLIAGFLIQSGRLKDYWLLNDRAMIATGKIVRQTCDDHYTVHYEFLAAGKSYTSFGRPRKPCPEVNIGDQIEVFYLEEQPTINMLRSPSYALKNQITFITIASLFPATVLFFVLLRSKRKRKGENRLIE